MEFGSSQRCGGKYRKRLKQPFSQRVVNFGRLSKALKQARANLRALCYLPFLVSLFDAVGAII